MLASRSFRALLGLSFSALAVAAACGADFEPQTRLTSVRILGAQADKPIAVPGEKVTVELLAYDARADKQGRPMKTAWLPAVCINPIRDLYYACFSPSYLNTAEGEPLFSAADAGASDGGTIAFGGGGTPTRAELDEALRAVPFSQGSSFQFTMPADVVTSHPVQEGTDPYGMAVLFNMACAGTPRIFAPDPAAGPQQLPFACEDERGQPLGPDEFVVGLFRVYSYADVQDPAGPEGRKIPKTNANPVIRNVIRDAVTPFDVSQGITLPTCPLVKNSECPPTKIDIDVPIESWETYPDRGVFQKEQIYVAYYSTVGTLNDTLRLLYDPVSGRIEKSDVEFRAPSEPGEGLLFAVIHDNRGGAAWAQIPLHIVAPAP